MLNSRDICHVLLNEYATQSDHDEIALSAYPFGTDTLIESKLDDILSFILCECDDIFSEYTRPLLASTYGPNILFRLMNPSMLREELIQDSRIGSSVKSMDDCVSTLRTVVALISHCVDITESMKLPMKIASKLFSRMSILFSIPMKSSNLSDYLHNAPEMVSIEAWCIRINAGCKLWDEKSLRWRRKSGATETVESSVGGWWEWLGWRTRTRDHEWSTGPQTPFKPNKAHNVYFAMASVSAMFVYVALVLNSSRK